MIVAEDALVEHLDRALDAVLAVRVALEARGLLCFGQALLREPPVGASPGDALADISQQCLVSASRRLGVSATSG